MGKELCIFPGPSVEDVIRAKEKASKIEALIDKKLSGDITPEEYDRLVWRIINGDSED